MAKHYIHKRVRDGVVCMGRSQRHGDVLQFIVSPFPLSLQPKPYI
jgi:hypothetical protein